MCRRTARQEQRCDKCSPPVVQDMPEEEIPADEAPMDDGGDDGTGAAVVAGGAAAAAGGAAAAAGGAAAATAGVPGDEDVPEEEVPEDVGALAPGAAAPGPAVATREFLFPGATAAAPCMTLRDGLKGNSALLTSALDQARSYLISFCQCTNPSCAFLLRINEVVP